MSDPVDASQARTATRSGQWRAALDAPPLGSLRVGPLGQRPAAPGGQRGVRRTAPGHHPVGPGPHATEPSATPRRSPPAGGSRPRDTGRRLAPHRRPRATRRRAARRSRRGPARPGRPRGHPARRHAHRAPTNSSRSTSAPSGIHGSAGPRRSWCAVVARPRAPGPPRTARPCPPSSTFSSCRRGALSGTSRRSSPDRPDAVLVEYDRGAFAAPIVAAARSLGIPTATMVHGSVHPHGYTPLLADVAFCWGEAQARQLEQAGASPDRLIVTGCQRVGLHAWDVGGGEGRARSRRPAHDPALDQQPPGAPRPAGAGPGRGRRGRDARGHRAAGAAPAPS